MRRLSTKVWFFVLPPLLVCFAFGCGGDGTYNVSGKITFKGQPVPEGKIYFFPDGSKGNNGTTGFADIKDGYYDTSRRGGRGVSSGAVIIAIEGIDPSAPPDIPDPSGEVTKKMLFQRYEVVFDVPNNATTKDIEVPEAAAKGPITIKPSGGGTSGGAVIIP